MSIEIPRKILPGGEIKDLPNITPTRFHHSATTQQHADALHLSNVVMQMSLLSNVFQNVLTPVTVNVGSRESIVHGGGAFINPTRASLYVTQIRPTSIRNIGRIPTVQELNLHNDIHAQELNKDNNMHVIGSSASAIKIPNANVIHAQNTELIEASFNDVNEKHKTIPAATKTVQGEIIHNDNAQSTYSEKLNQKIFTIYKDIFLIIGSNNNTETITTIQSTSALQPYTSWSATSSANIPAQALNEFIERKVNIEKKPVPTKPVDEAHSQFLANNVLNSFPLLMMNSITIAQDVHVSKTSAFIEHSLTVVNPKLVLDVVERLNQNPHEINNDTGLTTVNRNMQMNEMIVDLPLQEPVTINADNFEWVNLFTVPQKTVNVRVGSINKDGGGIPINNAMLIDRLNVNDINTENGLSAIRSDVTVIERPLINSVVVNMAPQVTWQHLHRNNVDQNSMARAGINTISQPGDEHSAVGPYTGIISDAKSVIHNDQLRPKMTGVGVRNTNKFNRKVVGYYGPFINHNMGTGNFVSKPSGKNNIGAKLSNLWNVNTLNPVVRDNGMVSVGRGRSNRLLRVSSSSKTKNPWTAQRLSKSGIPNQLPNNQRNVQLGNHIGTNVVVAHSNTNRAMNAWKSKQPGIANQPYHQQWITLNNNGVKVKRYDKGISDKRPILWTNRFTYPGVRQYPDGRIGRIPITNRGRNSGNRSKQLPKTNWSNASLMGQFLNDRQSAWVQSRSMMMNRDLSYQGLQLNMNWGMCKTDSCFSESILIPFVQIVCVGLIWLRYQDPFLQTACNMLAYNDIFSNHMCI